MSDCFAHDLAQPRACRKKKNPRCLEYIIVHELTHFQERTHDERFVALLDEYLPDWRSRRDQLNEAPLAQEESGEHAVTHRRMR